MGDNTFLNYDKEYTLKKWIKMLVSISFVLLILQALCAIGADAFEILGMQNAGESFDVFTYAKDWIWTIIYLFCLFRLYQAFKQGNYSVKNYISYMLFLIGFQGIFSIINMILIPGLLIYNIIFNLGYFLCLACWILLHTKYHDRLFVYYMIVIGISLVLFQMVFDYSVTLYTIIDYLPLIARGNLYFWAFICEIGYVVIFVLWLIVSLLIVCMFNIASSNGTEGWYPLKSKRLRKISILEMEKKNIIMIFAVCSISLIVVLFFSYLTNLMVNLFGILACLFLFLAFGGYISSLVLHLLGIFNSKKSLGMILGCNALLSIAILSSRVLSFTTLEILSLIISAILFIGACLLLIFDFKKQKLFTFIALGCAVLAFGFLTTSSIMLLISEKDLFYIYYIVISFMSLPSLVIEACKNYEKSFGNEYIDLMNYYQ